MDGLGENVDEEFIDGLGENADEEFVASSGESDAPNDGGESVSTDGAVTVVMGAKVGEEGGLGGLGPKEKTGAGDCSLSFTCGAGDASEETALDGGGVGTAAPKEKTGALEGASVMFTPAPPLPSPIVGFPPVGVVGLDWSVTVGDSAGLFVVVGSDWSGSGATGRFVGIEMGALVGDATGRAVVSVGAFVDVVGVATTGGVTGSPFPYITRVHCFS